MTNKWKDIVLEYTGSAESSLFITKAIERFLIYDTSLQPREDIDKCFSKERISNLAMKALSYYESNMETFQIAFPKSSEQIVNIIRAHLAGFEPNVVSFDIESYEVWRDTVVKSRDTICQFYAEVDRWLREVDKKPLVPDELQSLLPEFKAYSINHDKLSVGEWLKKDCRIYFTKGYDSSIWRVVKFKIEDCASYDFFKKYL